MKAYQTDRQWSDQFIPTIRVIVGPYLLVPSSFEIDTKEAADLIVLKGRDMTIAARVRRPGYADRYPYEFTVRSRRDSGAKTEMAKLLEGLADWMLYAHASNDAGQFTRWWLIDLHQWRERLLRAGYAHGWSHFATEKANGDGTFFLAFDLRAFVPTVLIAGSHELAPADEQALTDSVVPESSDEWIAAYEKDERAWQGDLFSAALGSSGALP